MRGVSIGVLVVSWCTELIADLVPRASEAVRKILICVFEHFDTVWKNFEGEQKAIYGCRRCIIQEPSGLRQMFASMALASHLAA